MVQKIYIKYKDLEDGDLTTVKEEEEFQVMLNQFRSFQQNNRIEILAIREYTPSYRSNASSQHASKFFQKSPENHLIPLTKDAPPITNGELEF